MWSLILENQFGRKDRYVSDNLKEETLDAIEAWYNNNISDENWIVVNVYKMEGDHTL